VELEIESVIELLEDGDDGIDEASVVEREDVSEASERVVELFGDVASERELLEEFSRLPVEVEGDFEVVSDIEVV
jgi:hypothetical protein